MPYSSRGHARSAVASGPALVVLGLICQEAGAALAVTVFPASGPVGMVALRLIFSTLVLGAIVRPRLHGLTHTAWRTAASYGLVLAAMNVFFYLALERLPLGTAVTLEILGPLTLSVVIARRWLNTLWAFIALVGVILLAGTPAGALDLLGVGFALTAAALWAGYILLTRRAGEHFTGLLGVCIGMGVGSVAVLPLALATTGAALFEPRLLLLGLAIALLSSTAPYTLEMLALRRMPPTSFAILLALAPAIAALAGLIILGQHLGVLGYLGIALVVSAGIGTTRTTRGTDDSVATQPVVARDSNHEDAA